MPKATKPHPLRKSNKLQEHRDRLRVEAAERLSAYILLSTKEKLAKLDAGSFKAVKQRARLNAPPS